MSKRNYRNNKYSPELKLEAVESYLCGEGSLDQICKKYGLRSDRQLRNWISCYNGHKEFKRPVLHEEDFI